MTEGNPERTDGNDLCFALETTPAESDKLLEAVEEARRYWTEVADEHGWLDEWEDEGRHVQLWLGPDLEVLDSVYLRGASERDVVVFRMPPVRPRR